MPLRPDEVIPVQKHREGSSDQTMNNENREHRTRENDKKISKKSKKDRHQKSNRDEVRDSLEDSNTKFFSGDLLGLECGVSTSLISPPVTLEDNEHVLEAVSSSKQSKKSKKKDALLLWRTLPLPGVMNVRAFYHIFGSLSSDLIEIQLFLVNDSLVSSGNSVSFQGRVDGASNIITISDVKAGKSAVSSKVGMHMSARRSQSRTLLAPLAAKISFENLLGSSDILTVSTYLPVPSSIIFRPFEVNDGEFADIISSRGGSKGCSFYGSTSGIIHVMVNNVHEESVSKYILKALAALLGGYVVHRDGSKAITVCSRANNTDILCCLFKFRDFSNGEYRLNVDVKYMSTAESVDVNGCASDILTSLNNTLLG